MEIKDMNMEQIEARKAEIRELLNAEDCDVDALSAEVDELEERAAKIRADVEQRKAVAAKVASGAGEVVEKVEKVEERKMSNIEVRNTPEYIDAYAKYIKTNDPTECRDILVTSNVGGSVQVPDMVYDIVKTAWEREGIMSLVRKSYIRGNLKVGFEISGDPANVHEEGDDAPAAEDLYLGVVELFPASIKKWIQISDEAMDLTGESFLRYIYDEISYRIAKKAADMLIANIEACDTVSTATCPGVPIVGVSAVGLGDIATAMGYLSDEAANPVVVMNKQTWAAYKAAQYQANFAADPFEGLNVVFNNTLTAASAASDGDTIAIVGDFGQGSLANFPRGEEITFKFDDLTDAPADLIRIIGREFVALGVVAPDAFVKIQIAE